MNEEEELEKIEGNEKGCVQSRNLTILVHIFTVYRLRLGFKYQYTSYAVIFCFSMYNRICPFEFLIAYKHKIYMTERLTVQTLIFII